MIRKAFFSDLNNTKYNVFNFIEWFIGFCDAESNFSIVPKLDSKGILNRFSFMFTIGLHKDDIEALQFIRSELNIGTVRIYGDECKFIVTKREDISKLISIFETFNLNTDKYLDYLSFKEAFNLYTNRENVLSEQLTNKLLEFKEGMNKNRTNFNMPVDHKITVTISWLLGLIEGEGSFQLWRKDFVAVFSLVLSERQFPVLEEIKQFLAQNLGFDPYSIIKLNSTSAITINQQKARNNSKASFLLIIKNIYVLNNYFVPFLDGMKFITKKGKDFEDFKIICNALYTGAHLNNNIRTLILKLSLTMNNYRLSTNSESVERLSDSEYQTLVNASPCIAHLSDGRQRDLNTGKIIHQHSSNVYEVIKPNKQR